MNKYTKEHNELFNKNCQLFMSKYNIFKSHDNPIINDIGKLIMTHSILTHSITSISIPDMQNIDNRALHIYGKMFPEHQFFIIENTIKDISSQNNNQSYGDFVNIEKP